MKILITNKQESLSNNINVLSIVSTEMNTSNKVYTLDRNEIGIIKYSDTEEIFLVKDLASKFQDSKQEILIEIKDTDLEGINSPSGGGDSGSYKVYTALLNQSSTNAPVATVLENTLGFEVIWSYVSTGLYNTNIDSSENYIVTQGGIQEKLSGQTTEMYNYQFGDNGGVVALAKSWFRAGGTVVPINTLDSHLVEIKVYN